MTTLLERRGAGRGGSGISHAENPSKTPHAGQALSAVLGALPPNSEERLGLSRELESLGRETDEGIFDAELWRIAVREEARGNSDFALRAYGWLAENGGAGARARAAESLARAGEMGGAGSRFEDLSRRFARETGDPATLLAMAVGGGVYRATRLAAMTRLAGGAGALGRGLGLKIAGSAAGLAVEAPAFTAVARWCGGRGISDAGFKEELLSSYLVLGGLKAMGGGRRRGYRKAWAGPRWRDGSESAACTAGSWRVTAWRPLSACASGGREAPNGPRAWRFWSNFAPPVRS